MSDVTPTIVHACEKLSSVFHQRAKKLFSKIARKAAHSAVCDLTYFFAKGSTKCGNSRGGPKFSK